MTTKPNRYSNSSIQNFQQCPLKFRYRNLLHLQPVEGDNNDLVFGKAMHKALETLYTTDDLSKAKESLREHYPNQINPSDLAKTLPNGLYTLDKYVEHYRWDKNWEIVAAEEMDSTEDRYVVKLDLVVRDTDTGSIYGVDHKISGNYLDYKFFNRFNPNSQVTQYVRYIKEKYGACDGFIINALGFKYRSRKYKDEPAGFWCAFERQVVTRSQQQIDQDQISKQYWIDRIEEARASGVWGMNTSQCFLCEYQPACSAGWDWEHDAQLITNVFKQVCDKWISAQDAHCNLDLGHDTDHDFVLDTAAPTEFQVEV